MYNLVYFAEILLLPNKSESPPTQHETQERETEGTKKGKEKKIGSKRLQAQNTTTRNN